MTKKEFKTAMSMLDIDCHYSGKTKTMYVVNRLFPNLFKKDLTSERFDIYCHNAFNFFNTINPFKKQADKAHSDICNTIDKAYEKAKMDITYSEHDRLSRKLAKIRNTDKYYQQFKKYIHSALTAEKYFTIKG